MLKYRWLAYNDFSIDLLYEVLRLRQEVFVVEQNCPYLDIDGLDQHSWHLLGEHEDGNLSAYLRITLPGFKYSEPAIGRVITHPKIRGTGAGRELMMKGIEKCTELFPAEAIRLSAQVYAKDFYASFGFVQVGDPYDEDGIPHIQMLRK